MNPTAPRLRRVGKYALVGLGVVVFGLALSSNDPASGLVDAALEALGNDYFLLAAFGALALVVFGGMALRRAIERVDQAAPPDPETIRDAPRPGHRFDTKVTGWPGRAHLVRSEDDIRERVRTAAVETLVRTDGLPRETAARRVDEGTWTDDDTAAAFLAADASGPTLGERLNHVLRGDSWTQHAASASARAVVERADSTGETATETIAEAREGDS
ncbi:DUF7269 family protein [Haloarcula marina]|uniref:DUF7269 family protein n=1 Tax=Haloarcula marina TaxID=2961574 RepID=UPI0020B7FE3C|nr:hypothetical protein [Halomicroarcula marina]